MNQLSAVLLAAVMVVTGALMPGNVAEAAYQVIDYYDTNYLANVKLSQIVDGLDNVSLCYDPVWHRDPVAVGFYEHGAKGPVTLTVELPSDLIQEYDISYEWYEINTSNPISTTNSITLFNKNTEIQPDSFFCNITFKNKSNLWIKPSGNVFEFCIDQSSNFNNWRVFDKNHMWAMNLSHSNLYAINANPSRQYKTVTESSDTASASSGTSSTSISNATFSMYRFRHPTTGEHLYTASAAEAANVKKAGWIDETPAGGAWKAPTKSSAPIYRLYNPNKKTNNHLYSMNQAEMANLTKAGWKVEGIAYYSDTNKGVPIYREYNKKTGDHNYTTNLAEHNQLASQGWTAEGIAWYGVK